MPAAITVHPRIADIDAGDWDRLANPDAARANPFVSHAFLNLLEECGAVSARTGWMPQHLTLKDGSGKLIAAAPCYLKSHSRGEYVFDYAWAEAYQRAGGSYYPKLQVAVPFTPVPGPRLLIAPDADRGEATLLLLNALAELSRKRGASSFHITFMQEDEWRRAGELGCLKRLGQQFHWLNRGFHTYEEFLVSLSSRKRKAIRRERREAIADGVAIERLSGNDIRRQHWDAMFEFYMDTGGRKWGSPYLNRRAFDLIGERMADKVLLVLARREGRYIAGALNLIGGDCLYGRYWGTIEPRPFLHFEVCYHQAIEYAIAAGLARVEAGAQGEHKLARGYLPVAIFSAHFILDKRLSRAVAEYLERERDHVEEANRELAEAGPYRNETD
ncbi:MAG: N-acetyltransferase [Hyphomicrobiaceae bacterium]|nr:MAG: N-acetyltransferase [Hyphomicrobiaceae bacterium]